jgi:hypothetical protein
MSIQVLKLISGEDIIGAVEETEKCYVITKPVCVFIRRNPDKENSFRLGVAPWAPYALDAEVPIFKNMVVSKFAPDEALVKEYERRGYYVPNEVEIKQPELLQES